VTVIRAFVVVTCGVAGIAALAGGGYWAVLRDAGAPQPAVAKAQGAVAQNGVTALGRLEPKDGVIRVAGPSHPTVVIGQLFIDDGDPVKAGQTIAILDSYESTKATVEQLEAELKNAEAEWRRNQMLLGDGFVSKSEYEARQTKMEALRAKLQRARAELDLAVVRSPIDGQVLEVHARQGERVGPDGIAELGQTDRMYAVAEVYETDITKVKVGQRATISSPALRQPVQGTVDRVGLKVGKKDVLSVDPAAKTDARVVEVEILLDDATQVGGLTNLEVDVLIAP
jgi:HlyD family secretion protein